jgi:DNA-binding CsgD family transcriptional regulator
MNRGSINALTETQKTCLRLVHDHLSSKDIARKLGCSPHTVDTHVRNAIKLLAAQNRFDAAKQLVAFEGTGKRALSSRTSRLPPATQAVTLVAQANPAEQGNVERQKRNKLLPLPDFWGEQNDLSNSAKVGWILLLAVYICVSLGALVAAFQAVDTLF